MNDIVGLQSREIEDPQGAESIFGLRSWVSWYGSCYHERRRKYSDQTD